MKLELTSKSLSFDGTYIMGSTAWVLALYFMLKGQWEWTLMLSIFGTLLFCFAYWRGKRKKLLHDFVGMVCIVGFFSFSFILYSICE